MMTISHLKPWDVLRVLASVPDPIRRLLIDNPSRVLAGGFIRDVLLGEEPKDLDVFCATRDDSFWCAASVGKHVKGSTFSRTVMDFDTPVQFVFYREFLDAEDLVSQFDFRACATGIYWCPNRREFVGVCVSGFYEDLAAKRLTFLHQPKDEGSLVPLKRALHLAAKGWKLPDESVAGILTHWQPTLQPESTLQSLRPRSYGGRR